MTDAFMAIRRFIGLTVLLSGIGAGYLGLATVAMVLIVSGIVIHGSN
jgi:hypothetical protein